jgi:Protein NO VEIN, C-terminal
MSQDPPLRGHGDSWRSRIDEMVPRDPILFCVITWMENYVGVTDDQPSGGGSFIDIEGYGYEIFNFRPFRKRFLGFVEPGGRIALERLGGDHLSEYLEGVTVVFVAPFQGEGPYVIVGWYKNATVYRSPQEPPDGSGRVFDGDSISFNLSAAQKDGFLIQPADNRVFQVPRGKGGIGQSRIWYADRPEQEAFVRKVRRYVETKKTGSHESKRGSHHGNGWQHGVERRQLIERVAVRVVWNHFEGLGYALKSVERENRGWDLEATLAATTLRLEVKGTAGNRVSCEVTPNEYRPISEKMPGYRLCIVCDALGSTPSPKIFAWSREQKAWCSQGERLSIMELVGARFST